MDNLQVPVVDISLLLQSSAKDVGSVVQEISKACENWGFFYVINHNVDTTLISDVQREGIKFFEQPKEVKDTVARFEGNFQGYSDSELTKQKVDWKQIFDYSSEDSFKSINSVSSANISGIHGKNQWPNCNILPKFKPTLITYFNEVRKLGLILMDSVFQGLKSHHGELRESIFPAHPCQEFFSLEEDTSFGRLNYYPAYHFDDNSKIDQLQLGVGPHSDAGVLTILYQMDGVCSLQVEKNGSFHDVPPIKDLFVINIGDMMQVWSNGRYHAPVHRVLTNPTKPRFSLPFFLNPKYSCVVEPLTGSVREEKKYKPILWSEFRRGRVQGDYADLGEELQISHYANT